MIPDMNLGTGQRWRCVAEVSVTQPLAGLTAAVNNKWVCRNS